MALKEMETCMLEAKDLNPNLWDEAINCAAYIQNISPNKYLDRKTTYEAWFGHKPSVSHFKVFGSKAWARIPPKKERPFNLKERIPSWFYMLNMKRDTRYLIPHLRIHS